MIERAEAQQMAEKAVEIAEGLGLTLDYSHESVGYLEAILDAICKERTTQGYGDDLLSQYANIFGAYLGETMLQNDFEKWGFAWGLDTDGEPCLMRENAPQGLSMNKMAPLTKVFKRMVNGPEDSVVQFYLTCRAMAKMEG